MRTTIAKMSFAKIYPLLVLKAVKKGRTKGEVDEVIYWLTGYDEARLQNQLERQVDNETFFAEAPAMNPDAAKITGIICKIRVETIEDPLERKVRQLDKLVDDLAKGKPMEKVLRR